MRSRFTIMLLCNLVFCTSMQAGRPTQFTPPSPGATPTTKEKVVKDAPDKAAKNGKTGKISDPKPTPGKKEVPKGEKVAETPKLHPKQPHIHIPTPPPSKLTISMELAPLPGEHHELSDIVSLTPPTQIVSGFNPVSGKFPWKEKIVTTIFWVGELAGQNNPVPNTVSSWDSKWQQHYGGVDTPNAAARNKYIPTSFRPNQNPFYCALPYNDIESRYVTKPEAERVIPWFRSTFKKPGVSVCKDRWVAIRKDNRVCYAQWSDCGPFRTDHWQYVFGNERPKPNLNHGAGLDVSPAVRDFLGLSSTDVTDWKFVEFADVPMGPWARYGENNHFVIEQRKIDLPVASNN